MASLRIRYKLRKLQEVEPWGIPGSGGLRWFGLTDGCYCVETLAGTLLELDGPVNSEFGRPWCEYQVARIFEDFVQCWPNICDPIPFDIINHFASWYASNISADTIKAIDLWNVCKNWFDWHIAVHK